MPADVAVKAVEKVRAMLEATRAYTDAAFALGMAQAHADRAQAEENARSDQEEARLALARAEDDYLHAEAKLAAFHRPDGYPLTRTELEAALAAVETLAPQVCRDEGCPHYGTPHVHSRIGRHPKADVVSALIEALENIRDEASEAPPGPADPFIVAILNRASEAIGGVPKLAEGVRLTVWQHAEGGVYAYEGARKGKHPDTGEWVDGVSYRDIVTGDRYWTTRDRWRERFAPVKDASGQRVTMSASPNAGMSVR